MSVTIILQSGVNGFAEDKDQAREIRTTQLMPALNASKQVIIDFSAVRYATQSFIHALIGEVLQKYGDRALEMVEFKNCTAAVRGVIELVVDYSLGGFSLQGEGA